MLVNKFAIFYAYNFQNIQISKPAAAYFGNGFFQKEKCSLIFEIGEGHVVDHFAGRLGNLSNGVLDVGHFRALLDLVIQ